MIEQIKKSQDIAQAREISVRETSQLMKEGKVALLDVRCAEAFAVASIPGSKLIDEQLAEEIVHSWPRETPIVLVCHHGERTADAAEYLQGYRLRECEEPGRRHRRMVARHRSGGAAILDRSGSHHGAANAHTFSRGPPWTPWAVQASQPRQTMTTANLDGPEGSPSGSSIEALGLPSGPAGHVHIRS